MATAVNEARSSTPAVASSPSRAIDLLTPESRSVESAITDRVRAIGRYSLATIKHPGFLLGRTRYILLLGHPRCYTSLIAHIFGSHPEIVGSCETYTPLRNRRDLITLRYLTYWLNNRKTGGKYVFDKILVHYIPVSSSILNRHDVTVLFTLRCPDESVPSMARHCFDADHRGQPVFACEFYIKRLQSLEQHCLALKRKAFYFDGPDIILRTSDLLQALRRELRLNHDLSERYGTFGHTGIVGGDPSERIKSGCVDRKSRRDYHDVVVPDELMAQARAAYEHCRSLLRERCICL
jgi:hypothetical protein